MNTDGFSDGASRSMVECQEQGDKDKSANLLGTTKLEGILNSKARLEDLNSLRAENEELTCHLEGARHALNELQRGQDAYLNEQKATDLEIHDLKEAIKSLYGVPAKGNDRRLEAGGQLNSCPLQIKGDHKVMEVENSTLKAEQAREELENRTLKAEQLRKEIRCQANWAFNIVNLLQRGQDSTAHLGQNTPTDQEIHDLKRVIRNLDDATAKNYEEQLEARARLDSCWFQIYKRDQKILELENRRVELEARVEKVQQQLFEELEGSTFLDGSATPVLLESTLKGLQTSTSSFVKLFLSYCKSHAFDAHHGLKTRSQNTYLTRPGHVTYILKGWIFDTIFRDFENESFKRGGASVFLDDAERRMKAFEYFELLQKDDSTFFHTNSFQHFRHQKLQDFLSLWKSSDLVAGSHLPWKKHENPDAVGSISLLSESLMQSFSVVAKGAWALHKLSLSFQPRADIFRVNKGTKFQPEFMESVVSIQDDENLVSQVGFMICPGFRLRQSVVKCQIYLAGSPTSSTTSAEILELEQLQR